MTDAGSYADPYLLLEGATAYVYSTNAEGLNVPVTTVAMPEVVPLGTREALAQLPPWATGGLVWAPEVLALAGGYRLYYTVTETASGRQCISVATSAAPTGPFVDATDEPLVCQRDLGGSIDPNPFVVGGEHYLAWKSDGNCCGLPTVLWAAPLGPDGTTLGEPSTLLESSEPWEDGVAEGPSLFELDRTLHLLYSANRWDTDRYGIGHATCDGPLGPCTRSSPDPWLTSHADAAGPGGQAVVRVTAGKAVMLYHAWPSGTAAEGCSHNAHRVLYVSGLEPTGDGDLQLTPICSVHGGCG